jgi:hypothetical protein
LAEKTRMVSESKEASKEGASMRKQKRLIERQNRGSMLGGARVGGGGCRWRMDKATMKRAK